jgi:hypothetical protein
MPAGRSRRRQVEQPRRKSPIRALAKGGLDDDRGRLRDLDGRGRRADLIGDDPQLFAFAQQRKDRAQEVAAARTIDPTGAQDEVGAAGLPNRDLARQLAASIGIDGDAGGLRTTRAPSKLSRRSVFAVGSDRGRERTLLPSPDCDRTLRGGRPHFRIARQPVVRCTEERGVTSDCVSTGILEPLGSPYFRLEIRKSV